MEYSDFKKKMEKADTMKQGDNLIQQLNEIVQTLEKCKEFSGITLRDAYILSMAKIFLEKPESRKFYTKVKITEVV